MDMKKALIAGLVAGVALFVYEFVIHALLLAGTYAEYNQVFRQDGNPVYFPLLALAQALAAGVIFAKTRSAWGAGFKGGATFGFWIGLVFFFREFYNPLTIEGFPYYLAWCWGTALMLGWIIAGSVMSLMYKE